ncbi:acyl carrier protein phosphodiesterase [Reinekea forsetii]|jgi:acyl carrier protein phosphodiesterase|uniref:Acyl carrier protein phosphodiesterase n=1 Tax=Reinekea forsetii TaxID=1336806 RepID=A0A2K8KP67_9GAMM|nr:acyl carrier protein phosphodiesterase [Reinekea forsetii]ATX75671.1 acyl carrier protein phosphodiesterase [Reinekea forsetii]MDO7642291.1 acyl carrier protein phosphodiesterase [Reinekea forsetii]MDO7645686.1 acyl carrier protein phosphodiesterase [Reinekea forsetii]
MNFLGHCLFSDDTPAALAGSLWPDFARRPEPSTCSAGFLQHFDRHQWIDKTTDHHPLLEPLRIELRPVFRKTTPIVIDMMLDHHLAQHWARYHALALPAFAENAYHQLQRFDELTWSPRFERTLFWMTQQDWFVSYASSVGIQQALSGMAKRIRFDNPMVEHSLVAVHQTNLFVDTLDLFIEHLLTQTRTHETPE